MSTGAPARVALIGVRGFGASYVASLTRLRRDGEIQFAGAADLDDEAGRELPRGTPFHTDHRTLLATHRPDVTVIASPPHTHFPFARDALGSGSDVLVEKPPVVSMTQHRELVALCRARGRICQVGFQSLAHPATQRLLRLVAAGELGRIEEITVAAWWVRYDDYYRRSRWAGRRELDGMVVADGVATNPFAHPVMNALALARAADPAAVPVRLDVEAYRCRDIQTDDTVSARLHLSNGVRIVLAMTVCAGQSVDPRVTVHGTRAVAELDRTGTALRVAGVSRELPAGSGDPLRNLLAHRRDPHRVPLRIPLDSTGVFTAFCEGMLAAGRPHRVAPEFLDARDENRSRRVIVRGIDGLIARAERERALFSELGVAWATTAATVDLAQICA